MTSFLLSPYSVPVLIVAIVMITTMITKVAKMRYGSSERNKEQEENTRREFDELRRRIENLETIVVNLENRKES